MTCGCPVVASNTTSIPEVAGDAAMLFAPNDADGIADAVDRLVDDSELRLGAIQKGMERSRLFSWQKCIDSHLKLYESIL